jgi:hypothetical protein
VKVVLVGVLTDAEIFPRACAPGHPPMRDSRISLDGRWDFLHLIEDYRTRPVQWRSITVPSPWQAQFPDLRTKGGSGLYRREISIPIGWQRGRVFLCFGGVFHITQAWVNGMVVGSHVGGFLPFSFDVTEHLKDGTNEIKVRVDSPLDDPNAGENANIAEIPFGKQSWYGPLSGIWQSVYLECRAADHIVRMRVTSVLETGRIQVHAALSRPASQIADAVLTITDPNERLLAVVRQPIDRDAIAVDLTWSIERVRAWSPDAPNLYRAEMSIEQQGQVVDWSAATFGFRTISSRDGQLFFNGEPLYLRAALDQDYYPDTICTTPSVAFLEDQFRKAKELGLNCLRLHIKAPDPIYYEVADRMGLLIWSELPNMGQLTERSRDRKHHTLRGIVDRDGNHPCIICWTIINENWGVDLVHDAEHRAWLKQTYVWLKTYDPGRLVVDNSPLAPSFHVQTDIADFHFYAAFPDSRRDWDNFIESLAARPLWLFSEQGDAVQTGEEPLMCSEFGNWGLPNPAALKDLSGAEPWWFETGHDWGDGVMYAHGIENRFADWSLARVFGTLEGFVEAAQWQQFRALKYEIEVMRAKKELAGYVITAFTDAHWECNGLLDMQRNPRVFHSLMHTINADTVIIARWERLTFWCGEIAEFELHVAQGAGSELRNTTVAITLENTTFMPVPDLPAGTVIALGKVSVPIPELKQSGTRRVQLELRTADGELIASNYLEIAIHSPRPAPTSSDPPIWAPDSTVRNRLEVMGYCVVPEPIPGALWVTAHHDAHIDAHVRHGGRLLLLPEGDFGLQPLFPHWQAVRVQSRDLTLWRGDWASTFAWLRRGKAFQRVPGGCLLDETFDRVLPRRVIVGCNLLDFQARVHAGLAIGWIHKLVATVVERSYGKGRFVLATFELFRDAPGADPTATALLDSLIELALAQGSAAARENEAVINELALTSP